MFSGILTPALVKTSAVVASVGIVLAGGAGVSGGWVVRIRHERRSSQSGS